MTMHEYYEALLDELGLPSTLADCMLGEIEPPMTGWESPTAWFDGFPPVMIPIWQEGIGWIGYWKHWFTDRTASFVRMYREAELVREIARTPEQFWHYALMRLIVQHDEIREADRSFAAAVGVTNLDELEAVALATGDREQGFAALSLFKSQAPLQSVTDVSQYDGTFPTGSFTGREWWHDACGWEVDDELVPAWPTVVQRPPWLEPGERPPLFKRYLQAGDLKSAWLTLNSPGWEVEEAVSASWALEERANDPLFTLLVDAWTEVADGEDGGY
jgi:hypothetical protein